MDLALILKTSSLAVAVAVNLLLAGLVFNNNPRSATNRVYAWLSSVMAVWLVVNYLSLLPALQASSLMWIRLSIFFATAMLALFILLAHTLPSNRLQLTGWRMVLLAVWTLVVMGVCISPLAFTQVEIINNSPQPVPGPGIAVFGLNAALFTSLAVGILVKKLRRSTGLDRQKFRYMMLGIIAMISLLILTVLLPVALLKINTFVAFIPVYTLVFLGMTTYAIVKHRLFDVRVVVARTVAYVLLLAALLGIYGLAIYGMSSLFFRDSLLSQGQIAAFIAVAVVLGFTFQPLQRFFERITSGIFFRDHYDSQEVLNAISGLLASELYLEPILDQSMKEICTRLRIASAQFMILEGDTIYRQVVAGTPAQSLMDVGNIKYLRQPVVVTDELEPGRRKKLLAGHTIRLSLMLQTKDQVVGFLFLGDKLSGEIYSGQDLSLLEILRKELAIAIVNAKAYEEIARFNITLQDRIEKATERLRAANKNLKVLDKTKDEFISMASHQLGTPLTAITGYLSMALDDDRGNMTKDQRQFVQFALEASERMGAMSSDLLNVSRLSAGRFIIRAESIDLVKMVQQEIDQLKPSADRKNLKLELVVPSAVPPILADVSKTRQVIMNFIDNAIYYTQTGSVTVKIEQEHDAVALSVIDTGIGVPPEEKAKLFTKFYRAGNAKAVRPDGTGLGLYLAKKVIEDQGGSLIFESEVGKGSTFGFVMPIKTTKTTAAPDKK
jgi:signal transduction histidine kinase